MVNRVNVQPANGIKYLKLMYLIFIYKELYNSIAKTNNLILKWIEVWNKHFSKTNIQMTNRYMRKWLKYNNRENANQNPNMILPYIHGHFLKRR